MGVWYTTREQVKAAAQNVTSRDDAQVDALIEGESRAAEAFLHRRFYPWTGTRRLRWPSFRSGGAYRLWLEQDEAISVSALTTDNGDTTIDASAILLEPVNDGPPYDRIEIDESTASAFSSSSTPQRAIALTGVFGASADERTAGALASSPNASATTWDVTDASLVGVGDLLRCDTERVQVTGRTWLTTGQAIAGDVAAQQNVVSFSVASGAALHVGEMLLIDSEKMLITDIAGNVITVKRAQDGSTLAAHAAPATVYAARRLTVDRGQVGTTAASHTAADVLYANKVPGAVNQLVTASVVASLNQLSAGMGGSAGSGESRRSTDASGLKRLRDNAFAQFGRIRTGAV